MLKFFKRKRIKKEIKEELLKRINNLRDENVGKSKRIENLEGKLKIAIDIIEQCNRDFEYIEKEVLPKGEKFAEWTTVSNTMKMIDREILGIKKMV